MELFQVFSLVTNKPRFNPTEYSGTHTKGAKWAIRQKITTKLLLILSNAPPARWKDDKRSWTCVNDSVKSETDFNLLQKWRFHQEKSVSEAFSIGKMGSSCASSMRSGWIWLLCVHWTVTSVSPWVSYFHRLLSRLHVGPPLPLFDHCIFVPAVRADLMLVINCSLVWVRYLFLADRLSLFVMT